MPRSTERVRRYGRLWGSTPLLVALALSGCVRREIPIAPGPMPAPVPVPGALPTAEPAVRVGLVLDSGAVTLTSSDGMVIRSPSGTLLRRAARGESVVFTSDGLGRLRLDGQVASPPVALATVAPLGGTISVSGRPYRGEMLVRSDGAGRVTAVNRVDMEQYLLGVVPREIGRVGPERYEAAKAQAVAARTYAVRYLGRRESLGFDVFATVQDQVYGGVGDEYDLVTSAVRETAGQILTYAGRPIDAYYHSTCAGQTAAIDEVWDQDPVPYLQSVRDVDPRTGQAYDRFSSRFTWTQRWSVGELEAILARTLADSLPAGVSSVGRLRDMEVLERTFSQRVRRLRITTSTATFTVGGDRVRWILLTPSGALLNSSRFDVRVVRDGNGNPEEVIATGGGWGHGIGMCQVGAMGRAEAGQDYRTILEAYYVGARIEDLY